MNEVRTIAEQSRRAASRLAVLTTEQKDTALREVARTIRQQSQQILSSNHQDLENGRRQGLSSALMDRLQLTEERLEGIAAGLEQLIDLPDPVGEVLQTWKREDGIEINKIRVPLGVIGMVYEARPNVTVDAAGLGLKTGNAMLLRGSSSALHSNMALTSCIQEGLSRTEVPNEAVQLVETTDRRSVKEMMTLNGLIDVIIPRGGANLIQRVVRESTVPVLETGAGICHAYIDQAADVEMANRIVIDAKTDRPGVCNAIETLLVHEAWAEQNLQTLVKELANRGVDIRGCPRTKSLISGVKEATDEDWDTEYLADILAVKVVDGVADAIGHIDQHGTRHSECIVTDDAETANAFLKQVDAASVYHNASTRFTDGGEFGFGAEIGISTQKLHARGPMGLPEMTTYKYVLRGSGQIRGGGPTSC